MVIAYGFVLAVLAVWFLTAGQALGSGLKDHLPVIGVIILGSLFFALASHQIHIFRVLGEDDV